MVYANNLDLGASSDAIKFPDGAQVGRPVRTDQDARTLQNGTDRLYDWPGRGQLSSVSGSGVF